MLFIWATKGSSYNMIMLNLINKSPSDACLLPMQLAVKTGDAGRMLSEPWWLHNYATFWSERLDPGSYVTAMIILTHVTQTAGFHPFHFQGVS